MKIKRIITPIVLALGVVSAQSAFSAFVDSPELTAIATDPVAQIDRQVDVMDAQSELLQDHLALLPTMAVSGPNLIKELDVDTQGLQTASLKVEESIIESLKEIEGQFKNTIPGQGLTKSFLASLPKARGDSEFACLAEALYFEARGESLIGQQAVAEVIMNRVQSKSYPNTICGVVNQGTGRKHQCQFSYTCDGNPEVIREPKAFDSVAKIARLMIDGLYEQQPLTNGAIFYHTTAVHPSWANVKTPTARFGVHIFYR